MMKKKSSISYEEFSELILRTRDSIALGTTISPNTVKFWFNKFFKYYPKEKLEKIFDEIIDKNNYGKFPSIYQLFEIMKEYGYNPLLHEQMKDIETKGMSNINFTIHEDLHIFLKGN